MRRVIALAAAALGLAGCANYSTPEYLKPDYYRSPPPPVQLQLESTPPGAEARTSLGPGCKTPCSVSVNIPADAAVTSFLVNYAMAGRQPTGVPVNIVRVDGGMFSANTVKLEPNPVVAELRPAGPPPRAERKPMRPKRKKPPADPGQTAPQQ